ncbi:hypothetical protein [Mucilaginibacter glaciei]|uniref:SPW repeat-containing protein n=1 Tax=Mucilaginibacter glaciei TaxID=2772109 RepID=A0A926NSK8_9SPHI|nr:hypothetical protein [Mucilaginibacter glaciei]MBD1393847.1 hypothetical protein [Mucilaginibacter glaciei]
MKIITPAMHGILDYLLVVFLWASPTLFVIPNEIAGYVYALGFIHLLLTATTDYTSGIFKFISFKIHGYIELAVGAGLVILAFTYFAYDERDKPFILGLGVAILIIFIFSDYNEIATSRLTAARMKGSKTTV